MANKRLIIAVVALLVSAGIVIGIAQREDSSLGSAATKAAISEADNARDSGTSRTLPVFEGKLFGGGTLASSDITGPAIIHVYGSWCPTCQAEAPAFAQLQRAQPELAYFFVAVEDDENASNEFTKSYGWKAAPTIDDSSRDVEEAFGLTGQPHTIFVAKNGSITVHQGPGSFGDLNMLAEQIA